jgi:hypothetical protein
MNRKITLTLTVLLYALIACAPMNGARDALALHERAKRLWQQNMAIVDDSVEFWKKRTGAATHTPEELEKAIEFFETVTQLRGRTNMSFIGPIPDESLEGASREWKAWYESHAERLTYDASTKRVILEK